MVDIVSLQVMRVKQFQASMKTNKEFLTIGQLQLQLWARYVRTLGRALRCPIFSLLLLRYSLNSTLKDITFL